MISLLHLLSQFLLPRNKKGICTVICSHAPFFHVSTHSIKAEEKKTSRQREMNGKNLYEIVADSARAATKKPSELNVHRNVMYNRTTHSIHIHRDVMRIGRVFVVYGVFLFTVLIPYTLYIIWVHAIGSRRIEYECGMERSHVSVHSEGLSLL